MAMGKEQQLAALAEMFGDGGSTKGAQSLMMLLNSKSFRKAAQEGNMDSLIIQLTKRMNKHGFKGGAKARPELLTRLMEVIAQQKGGQGANSPMMGALDDLYKGGAKAGAGMGSGMADILNVASAPADMAGIAGMGAGAAATTGATGATGTVAKAAGEFTPPAGAAGLGDDAIKAGTKPVKEILKQFGGKSKGLSGFLKGGAKLGSWQSLLMLMAAAFVGSSLVKMTKGDSQQHDLKLQELEAMRSGMNPQAAYAQQMQPVYDQRMAMNQQMLMNQLAQGEEMIGG